MKKLALLIILIMEVVLLVTSIQLINTNLLWGILIFIIDIISFFMVLLTFDKIINTK